MALKTLKTVRFIHYPLLDLFFVIIYIHLRSLTKLKKKPTFCKRNVRYTAVLEKKVFPLVIFIFCEVYLICRLYWH